MELHCATTLLCELSGHKAVTTIIKTHKSLISIGEGTSLMITGHVEYCASHGTMLALACD